MAGWNVPSATGWGGVGQNTQAAVPAFGSPFGNAGSLPVPSPAPALAASAFGSPFGNAGSFPVPSPAPAPAASAFGGPFGNAGSLFAPQQPQHVFSQSQFQPTAVTPYPTGFQLSPAPAVGFQNFGSAQGFAAPAPATAPVLGFGAPATAPVLGFGAPANAPVLGFGAPAGIGGNPPSVFGAQVMGGGFAIGGGIPAAASGVGQAPPKNISAGMPQSSQRLAADDAIARVQDAMTSIADTIATLHVSVEQCLVPTISSILPHLYTHTLLLFILPLLFLPVSGPKLWPWRRRPRAAALLAACHRRPAC
jgi:hypothetical protein